MPTFLPLATTERTSQDVSNVPVADIGLRDSFDEGVPQYKLRVRKIFG
jgi:hypothetical protein